MFANGNSYGSSESDLGHSAACDLVLTYAPRWFLPVTVWHPRAGK